MKISINSLKTNLPKANMSPVKESIIMESSMESSLSQKLISPGQPQGWTSGP